MRPGLLRVRARSGLVGGEEVSPRASPLNLAVTRPWARQSAVLVQIYGLTTPEDAHTVNALRPDHVGVVLDEGFDAWDSVDAGTARDIVSELTDVVVVALSLAVERDQILRTVDTLRPGILHLARAANDLTEDALASLCSEIAPVGLMVTVAVTDRHAISTAERLSTVADFLLLDSANPDTGKVGASGHVHDWSLSRTIVESSPKPCILAGGLGPANVAQAIEAVAPFGVDSETRTSLDQDRRRKDPDRVRRFIERARASGPPDPR
jgi:phosphoribosylanthranilate isomerase